MPVANVTLHTQTQVAAELQIWSDAKFPYDATHASLEFVSLVYYEKIPVFLLTNGPFAVYSDQAAAQQYFLQELVCKSPAYGVLARYAGDRPDAYMVFYAAESGLRCFCLDFSVPATVAGLHSAAASAADDCVFFSMKSAHSALRSDTSVFDRVLENKTKKSVAVPAAVSSSSLTTPQQVSQAISRTVSSGLRLRNLSANASSANDRVAIREIFQMTKTAAAFALRKYNYGFNGGRPEGVTLADIQAIVESLLQTFVDLDSGAFSDEPLHRVP